MAFYSAPPSRQRFLSTKQMAYKYDIFLSYNRHGDNGEWVARHFKPRFEERLRNLLQYEPRIYFDEDDETGKNWPNALAQAMSRTKLLVPVFSPPYFRSRWCLAEWSTMRARETALGMGGLDKPELLIHPVVYSDGDTFPDDAKSTSYEDFSDLNYPMECFKHSEEYLRFFKRVDRFAKVLAARLPGVPPWEDHWPVLRPDPPDAPHTPFPFLGQ